ncbi:tetraspanin-33-like [Pomacea canaliculata]|uniref:tetraspanin-33-like n=1 Tax=Pomacea canaliculata TaxID=400727 RepID=UPI000D72FF3C|nr:tetraspanin-33-like [Pomacea canaliculata]
MEEKRVTTPTYLPTKEMDISNYGSSDHVPSFTPQRKCCTRVLLTKYTLFTLNFVLFLAGGVLIGLGVWSRVRGASLAAFSDFTVDLSILLIVIGAVALVVCFFACLGALREQLILLKIYVVAVVALFVVQMVAGILAFVLLDTVERRSLALLRDAMASFGKGDHAERDNVIDSLQEMYYCCGGTSYQDWDVSALYNCSTSVDSACGVPDSCCLHHSVKCGRYTRRYTETYAEQVIYTRGCIGALMNVFKDNLIITGLITFAVGFLQIFSLLLAHCFMRYLSMGMKFSL